MPGGTELEVARVVLVVPSVLVSPAPSSTRWGFLAPSRLPVLHTGLRTFSRRSARQVSVQFSSVQSSRVRLFVNPRTAARQASLSITNSRNLLKLMSIESVMLSNHFIVCRPLLLSPALTLSQHQGLFQGVSSSHQVAKVLEFQLQHRV